MKFCDILHRQNTKIAHCICLYIQLIVFNGCAGNICNAKNYSTQLKEGILHWNNFVKTKEQIIIKTNSYPQGPQLRELVNSHPPPHPTHNYNEKALLIGTETIFGFFFTSDEGCVFTCEYKIRPRWGQPSVPGDPEYEAWTQEKKDRPHSILPPLVAARKGVGWICSTGHPHQPRSETIIFPGN